MGAMLTIAKEHEDNYGIEAYNSFEIDGKRYKPDTWYTLCNGAVVEVAE
jgi:hypothetical protein